MLKGTDVEISKPEGGFFIWIKLSTGTKIERLREAALKSGIRFTWGPAFSPTAGARDSPVLDAPRRSD